MRSRMLFARGLIAVSAATTVAIGGMSGATAAGDTYAIGYQQQGSHAGFQGDAGLTPPISLRWQRDLGGAVSYPLIADGLAYVTVQNSQGYGTKLYSLDISTGETVWGPIDLGGTYNFSGIALGLNRVLAVNYDGLLRSFDAATGAAQWTTQLPGQWAFTAPPTDENGLVYVSGAGSGGTVYAVHDSDGSIAWSAPVMNGDKSSPAVTATGVYVSYACNQAYDFDPQTGELIWHHDGPCEGGGGKTVAVNDNRVYTRDSYAGNLILNASTGQTLGSFSANVIPAFDGTTGFFLNYGTLSSVDETGTTNWSFTGDGSLDSAPIVDNGYVYVGSSSGNLYALSETDGSIAWTTNVGAPINAPDEQNVNNLTGLAASGNNLLVPASTTLSAYGRVGPSITATAAGTTGTNGWYTSSVKVHFTCTAGTFPIASCPNDVTVGSQGAGQVVSGTTTDTGGQAASTSVTLSIDSGAPSVAITSSSTSINREVRGNATDQVSGVSGVSVTFISANGKITEPATMIPCAVRSNHCFAWTAPAPPGLFGAGSTWTGAVTATATDVAGNTSTTPPTTQRLKQ